jgi:hypothetical protein
VSQDDAYWWQARKETDKTTRAGLIPSRALQERRIIHERTQMAKETPTNGETKSKTSGLFCLITNFTYFLPFFY